MGRLLAEKLWLCLPVALSGNGDVCHDFVGLNKDFCPLRTWSVPNWSFLFILTSVIRTPLN
jgi:hypothetical protein